VSARMFNWIGVVLTLACFCHVVAGNTELVSRFEHAGFPLSWVLAGAAIIAFSQLSFATPSLPFPAKPRIQVRSFLQSGKRSNFRADPARPRCWRWQSISIFRAHVRSPERRLLVPRASGAPPRSSPLLPANAVQTVTANRKAVIACPKTAP